MKKMIGGLICLSLIWALSGCTNTQESGGEEGVIEFWHTMSGENGEYLEELVEECNDQSDSIHVKPVYQGDYEDIQKKLRAGGGAKSIAPSVKNGESGVHNMVK